MKKFTIQSITPSKTPFHTAVGNSYIVKTNLNTLELSDDIFLGLFNDFDKDNLQIFIGREMDLEDYNLDTLLVETTETEEVKDFGSLAKAEKDNIVEEIVIKTPGIKSAAIGKELKSLGYGKFSYDDVYYSLQRVMKASSKQAK